MYDFIKIQYQLGVFSAARVQACVVHNPPYLTQAQADEILALAQISQ